MTDEKELPALWVSAIGVRTPWGNSHRAFRRNPYSASPKGRCEMYIPAARIRELIEKWADNHEAGNEPMMELAALIAGDS